MTRRRYTFGLATMWEHPMEPKTEPALSSFANTHLNNKTMGDKPGNHPNWRIYTFLNIELLSQLRRNDLNGSECMSLEWHLGNTVTYHQYIILITTECTHR